MSRMMKAVVLHSPGGPEVLVVEQRPVPAPNAGQVLIRVEAFGLNRSELFTRQGHSPGVLFSRILGIEAVGTVAESPGEEFRIGQTVATVMGGLGRKFDGGYAEYTVVPAAQVRAIDTSLTIWPDGSRRLLARAHPHGAWVEWFPRTFEGSAAGENQSRELPGL